MNIKLNLLILPIIILFVTSCGNNKEKDRFNELGEFIKLFLPLDSEKINWEIGGNSNNLSINWIDHHPVMKINRLGNKIYYKDALANIKVNGAYSIISKNKKASWIIRLWSMSESKPETANFNTTADCPGSVKNCVYDVKKMLTKSFIKFKETCKSTGSMEPSVLYSLVHERKKGLLLETTSCGSSGCNTLLEIIYNPNNKDVKSICASNSKNNNIAPNQLLSISFPKNNLLFKGYRCIKNCNGHQAGYDWAIRNNITKKVNCTGRSQSFIEGCFAYINKY